MGTWDPNIDPHTKKPTHSYYSGSRKLSTFQERSHYTSQNRKNPVMLYATVRSGQEMANPARTIGATDPTMRPRALGRVQHAGARSSREIVFPHEPAVQPKNTPVNLDENMGNA